jgi:hypothetical protein
LEHNQSTINDLIHIDENNISKKRFYINDQDN